MRLYRIDQVLQEEGSVSFETLQAALQCSAPTLKRDLRYMREKLGAPIVYSRSQNAYSYARDQKSEYRDGFVPKLPAAWYTPDEMYAFLAVVQLLGRIENDPKAVLASDMQALRSRLLAMLPGEFIQAKELLKRVKVIMPSVPNIDAPFFSIVGAALAQRRRLRITYFTRTRDAESGREISPLRLVNWRGRWYLDAWCHESGKLKTFAVENIRFAEMLDVRCRVVAMRDIEHALDGTYGIFSGGETKTAVIAVDEVMTPYERFTVWHKDQQQTFDDAGGMTLRVPYAREPEIAGEIMRLGSHAKVLAPADLIDYIREQHRLALRQYEDSEDRT